MADDDNQSVQPETDSTHETSGVATATPVVQIPTKTLNPRSTLIDIREFLQDLKDAFSESDGLKSGQEVYVKLGNNTEWTRLTTSDALDAEKARHTPTQEFLFYSDVASLLEGTYQWFSTDNQYRNLVSVRTALNNPRVQPNIFRNWGTRDGQKSDAELEAHKRELYQMIEILLELCEQLLAEAPTTQTEEPPEESLERLISAIRENPLNAWYGNGLPHGFLYYAELFDKTQLNAPAIIVTQAEKTADSSVIPIPRARELCTIFVEQVKKDITNPGSRKEYQDLAKLIAVNDLDRFIFSPDLLDKLSSERIKNEQDQFKVQALIDFFTKAFQKLQSGAIPETTAAVTETVADGGGDDSLTEEPARLITVQSPLEEINWLPLATALYQTLGFEQYLLKQGLAGSEVFEVRQLIITELETRYILTDEHAQYFKNAVAAAVQNPASVIAWYDANTRQIITNQAFEAWLTETVFTPLHTSIYNTILETEAVAGSLESFITSIIDENKTIVQTVNDENQTKIVAQATVQLTPELQTIAAQYAQLPSAEERVSNFIRTNPRAFRNAHGRLQSMLVVTLQLEGLPGVRLDTIPYPIRKAFDAEINRFLLTLSPEDFARLGDPTFTYTLFAKFNRYILDGRLSSQFKEQLQLLITNREEKRSVTRGEVITILRQGNDAFGEEDLENLADSVLIYSRNPRAFVENLSNDQLQKFFTVTTISDEQAKYFRASLASIVAIRQASIGKAGFVEVGQIDDSEFLTIRRSVKTLGGGRLMIHALTASSDTLTQTPKTETERRDQAFQGYYVETFWKEELSLAEKKTLYQHFQPTVAVINYEVIPQHFVVNEAVNYLRTQSAQLQVERNTSFRERAQLFANRNFGLRGRLAKGRGHGSIVNRSLKLLNTVAEQAAVNAVAGAADVALPGAGTAVRAADKVASIIEQATGIKKEYQAAGAAAAIIAFFANTVRLFLASWGGFVGGIIGGTLGTLFGGGGGVIGTVVGTGGGFTTGVYLGNTIGNVLGINGAGPAGLLNLDLSSKGILSKLGAATKTTGTTSLLSKGPFAFNNLAASASIATIGGAVVVSTLTMDTIHTALLLPTVTNGDISRYVTIEKVSQQGAFFDNPGGEKGFPGALTYSVKIIPKAGYQITITNITDTTTIKTTDENATVPDIPVRSMSNFGFNDGDKIPLTDTLELPEYTVDYGPLSDANITNTFEIEFTIEQSNDPSEKGTTQTAKTAEVICIGECPQNQNGCWPTSGLIRQLPYGSYSHKIVDAFDIAFSTQQTPAAPPIWSPFDGEACFYGWHQGGIDPNYGNHVFVKSGEFALVYGHLASFESQFQSGSCYPITAGTKLGTMGTTGNSSGVHLHWEIRLPGNGFGGYTSYIPGQNFNTDPTRLEALSPLGKRPGQEEFVRSCYEDAAQ